MARRTYHTSGVDIPLPPYFGEDGKEYSSYLEMVAANKAYRQQEERNQMLDEQTEAIKKQAEILERQERKQEELERKRLKEEQEKLSKEASETYRELRNTEENLIQIYQDIEKKTKKEIAKLKKKETLTKSEQKELENLQNRNYYAKYATLVMSNINIYANSIREVSKIMIYEEKENYKEKYQEEKKFIKKLQSVQGTIKETEFIVKNMEQREEQYDRDIKYKEIEHNSDIAKRELRLGNKIQNMILAYVFTLVFLLIGVFIIPVPSIILFLIVLVFGYLFISHRSKRLRRDFEIVKQHKEKRFKEEQNKLQTKKEKSQDKRIELSMKTYDLKHYGEEKDKSSINLFK